MWQRLNHTMRTALGSTLIASVGFALFFAVFAWHSYHQELEKGRLLVSETAHAYQQLTHFHLADIDRMLAGLADDFDQLSHPHNLNESRELLLHRKSSNPQVMDVVLLDASGQVIIWSADREVQPPDLRSRSYYSYHLRNHNSESESESHAHLTEPELSIVYDGLWFFSLSRPVLAADGELRGVVVAILHIETLGDLFGSMRKSSSLAIALLHEGGRIVLRYPAADYATGDMLPPPLQIADEVEDVMFFRIDSGLDGKPRILALRKVPDYPLYLIASTDTGQLFAQWRTLIYVLSGVWLLLSLAVALGNYLYFRQQSLFQERLQLLTTSLPGFIYQLERDPNGNYRYLYASEGVEKIFGIKQHEVLADANRLLGRIHPDEIDKVLTSSQAAAESNLPWHMTFRMRRGDGSYQWIEARDKALKFSDGSILWTGYTNDVSESKRIEEALREVALTDPLTGLPNRQHFFTRAEELLRDRQPFALLYLDLDGFKPVNDQFGHAIGDELLRLLAQRLLHSLRYGDLCGRVGGDEFLVLLRELENPAQAVALADRLRLIFSEPYTIAAVEHRVSCSIGISMHPHHSSDLAELMRKADEAMYLAKDAGRNRTMFYVDTDLIIAESAARGRE